MSKKGIEKGIGLVLFHEVREGFKAEAALKKAGYEVKTVLPPPEFRKGCDIAVQFNIVERVGIERILRDNESNYRDIVSTDAVGIKTLDLVKKTDFGDSIMVRAGHMKLTFDKQTGVIRNISGGGCPDVPNLYVQLVDEKITEVARPRNIGYTLCAYMLDKAYEEALKMYEEIQSIPSLAV